MNKLNDLQCISELTIVADASCTVSWHITIIHRRRIKMLHNIGFQRGGGGRVGEGSMKSNQLTSWLCFLDLLEQWVVSEFTTCSYYSIQSS